MYEKIINYLKNASKIALFVHINPDGDCIGSALATYTFLKKLGKEVSLQPTTVPIKLGFLKNTDKFGVESNANCDLALALDCGDSSRLVDSDFKTFLKCKTRVCIDHHEKHGNFAQYDLVEEKAASTTQIMYKIFAEYDKEVIDKDIAEMLYAGMVTDSGAFTFSCTSPETLYVAGKLVEYGIDVAGICRRLMKDMRKNVFQLSNRVLNQAKFYRDDTLGVMCFRKTDFEATGCSESDTDGMINSLLCVDTIELAISIAEIGERAYKVSFRSKTKVNVSSLARCFGGGGHERASGCRLYGYFEDVYNKLLSAAMEMMGYEC